MVAAAHGAALAFHAPQLAEEVFRVVLCQNGAAALRAQGVKGPLAHGQGTDVDGFHVNITSRFLFIVFLRDGGLGGVALQLLQLPLKSADLASKGLLALVMSGSLAVKLLNLRVDGGFLLGVAGLHFLNGFFQLGFPGGELCVLGFQLRQLR